MARQELRGTPRCTSSRIVDFGINLSKIFNDRNMVKVTKRVPREREKETKRKRRERENERERAREKEREKEKEKEREREREIERERERKRGGKRERERESRFFFCYVALVQHPMVRALVTLPMFLSLKILLKLMPK